jgi:hypothetical protein
MRTIDPKQQIIPLYLIVVMLLQVVPTVQTILLTVFPLVLLMISIHLKNKNLGLLGIFLFYTVALPQILTPTPGDFLKLFLEIVIVVSPSILLLSLILQLGNTEVIYVSEQKKPLLITVFLIITITGIFYLLTLVSLGNFSLLSESTEGQILLLAAGRPP